MSLFGNRTLYYSVFIFCYVEMSGFILLQMWLFQSTDSVYLCVNQQNPSNLACLAVSVSAGLFDWTGIEKKLHDFNLFEWILPKKDIIKKFAKNPNICHTQECFKIAGEFWEGMNKSVDPCEDFYEYVCGNWANANPVPPTELTWGPFQKIRKEVYSRVRELLEQHIKPNDILPVKQTKKFYKSCMDLQAINGRGIKPIEAFLARNGGWPMIMESEEWNSEQLTWQEINEYYSRLISLSAFYHISVSFDHRETNSTDDLEDKDRVITLNTPSVAANVIAMVSGKLFNVTDLYEDGTYAKYIKEIALIFAKESDTNIDLEQIEKDVNDIIELETKIQNITINETAEPQYVSIEEIQEIYDLNTTHLTEKSNIDWKKIMIKFFAEANVELDGGELIRIYPSDHFEVLADILDSVDLRIIVNYIHWNFVSLLLPFTTTKMEELRNELIKDKEGVKQQRPRWERCIRDMSMDHAVAYQFVKKYFKDKMKDDAEEVFSGIQKEMVKHILMADWLSDEMRKVELEKIKKMKMNVGYPDWYYNVTALASIYHGLMIDNQYMNNVLNLKKYSTRKWLQYLKKPLKKDEWFAHPLIVNAFYRPEKNSLTIPAADFQPPIYSLTQPKTVNYGELGIIISHEVAHGFDNSGIDYDQDGKKHTWPKEIKETFDNRTVCYVDQYKNFYSEDESMSDNSTERDGKMALGENIADSMGLEIIFGSLEENEKERKSPKLPGFEDFNNDQFFFLSYAKLWCSSTTPAFEKLFKKYHVHSKPNYRVNAPIQNSEKFAKVFDCPKGSPMNPEMKCKIW